MSKTREQFAEESIAMAKKTFGYMRLYCMEHDLKKEHIIHAIARLCVEMRDTYPDGQTAFDKLAAEAQDRYEKDLRSKGDSDA